MCIAAFVWQGEGAYELVLVQNRDEYEERETKAAAWWEGGDILGGRDEVGGGTWLGCSKSGRVALLTNVLEPPSPLPSPSPSRGHLPLLFLRTTKSPLEFGEELAREAHRYNGFNLLFAHIPSRTMLFLSNRPRVSLRTVSPGIHVLSNATLDTPWPKARRLEANFRSQLERYGESEIDAKEMVHTLMRDTVKVDDETQLPHICDADWELNLSSIFVQVDTPLGRYGTRSSAVLSVTKDGHVSFYETSLENATWHDQTFKYHIH